MPLEGCLNNTRLGAISRGQAASKSPELEAPSPKVHAERWNSGPYITLVAPVATGVLGPSLDSGLGLLQEQLVQIKTYRNSRADF